jgi:hypothetical protein
MWSTFNYLSTEPDVWHFGVSIHDHLKSNGLLVIDLPNHNRFSGKVHCESYENEYFLVTIWIQKRIVGNMCEGLYQYKIIDKKKGEDIILSDQELHRIYFPNEVEQRLKQWFDLRVVYGDYDLKTKYDKLNSDRAILCLVNKS